MTAIYFEVRSVLGVKVRTTEDHWKFISEEKHPIIKDYEEEVRETLRNPEEIRKSRRDERVHLYYKKLGKYYICVLVKHLNGEGFIITAYLADKMKKGEIIWKKSQK